MYLCPGIPGRVSPILEAAQGGCQRHSRLGLWREMTSFLDFKRRKYRGKIIYKIMYAC